MSLALAGSVLAAVATVVIVLVLVVAPGGSNRLDVVAEARAALPDRGDLVHLVTVTRQTLVGADAAAQRSFEEFARRHPSDYAPRRFEQWSTGDRWRVASNSLAISPETFDGSVLYGHDLVPAERGASPPDPLLTDKELERIGLKHRVTGPAQEAYANGADSLYVESLGAMIVSRIPGASSAPPPTRRQTFAPVPPVSRIPSFPGSVYVDNPTLLDNDPVAWLREALDQGALGDAGPGVVDGRAVHRLVDGSLEFDVDAETFAPVRVRDTWNWAGGPGSDPPLERAATDTHFLTFESMPVNAETKKLLEIHPESRPTIVHTRAPHLRGAGSERPKALKPGDAAGH